MYYELEFSFVDMVTGEVMGKTFRKYNLAFGSAGGSTLEREFYHRCRQFLYLNRNGKVVGFQAAIYPQKEFKSDLFNVHE